MKNRDRLIVKKILKYVAEIEIATDEYNLTMDILSQRPTPRNAIAMCILQIGELVGTLSDEFVDSYDAVPWRQIRAMRNIAAHNYEDFSVSILWDTIQEDIPKLKSYCSEILREDRHE
jgi:uncharacterized protein with HEPN domain